MTRKDFQMIAEVVGTTLATRFVKACLKEAKNA